MPTIDTMPATLTRYETNQVHIETVCIKQSVTCILQTNFRQKKTLTLGLGKKKKKKIPKPRFSKTGKFPYAVTPETNRLLRLNDYDSWIL